MHNKTAKKYIGMLVFAVLVIGIYKSWNTEFLSKFLGLLTPLFTGIILAYILYFPGARLERLIGKIRIKFIAKRARIFSIITVYALAFAIIYLLIRLLIPVLTKNLTDLIMQTPAAFNSFMEFLESHEFMGYTIDREAIMKTVTDAVSLDKIMSYFNFENLLGYVEGIVAVSSSLVNLLIGIIISIYLILQREEYFRLGNRLLSCIFRPDIKEDIIKYLHKINEFITRYFYCLVLDAVIMFFVSLAALLILDIPYAIVLATVVAVFNIVPYIGSILSTIILIVVTLFTEGLQRGIILGIVMFILQQIDGNVIAPYLVKDRLKINPVWVIVAVIVGGGFGGIIGIMLGVPIVAVIRIIANDLMHRREVIMKYRERHGQKNSIRYFGPDNKR